MYVASGIDIAITQRALSLTKKNKINMSNLIAMPASMAAWLCVGTKAGVYCFF